MSSSPAKSNDIVKITKEGKTSFRIGFDPEVEQKIDEKAQEIANGLSCGFGG